MFYDIDNIVYYSIFFLNKTKIHFLFGKQFIFVDLLKKKKLSGSDLL